MTFAGSWNVVINSPVGKQTTDAHFDIADDGTLTGKLEAPQGSMDVSGTVDRDSAHFKGKAKMPMPITLEYNVTMDGDDAWSGKIKTGPFGTHPITATRA